jgi:CRP-like cAMP-binding protein
MNPGSLPNSLLASLPRKDREAVLEDCTLVRLNPGERLATPGALLPQAYFPLDSWIALVAESEGQRLDLALVGNDGVIGASLVLGMAVSPTVAIVRGEGTALAIPAQAMRRHLARSAALNHAFQHRVFFELSQAARAAACCRFHVSEKRLAGYLLRTADCALSDRFRVTQACLAESLGLSRGSATTAARVLQARHLIRYSNGTIAILLRTQLQAASCRCYEDEVKDRTLITVGVAA